MSNFRSGNLTPGQNFGNFTLNYELTETDTVIDVKDYGIINLYSSVSDPEQANFSLEQGVIEGQIVTLNFLSESPNTCLFDVIGNAYTRLNTNWQPLQYDQIRMMWTTGLWIETSRYTFLDNVPVDIEPFSSKWTSQATVQWFGNKEYAIMSGTMTSTADTNTDKMGVLPDGYNGSFAISCVADIVATGIDIIDVNTFTQDFGGQITFADGDIVYVSGIVYPIIADA